MRIILSLLLSLFCVSAFAQKTLTYHTNDFWPTPTNFFSSNVLAGPNISIAKGDKGRLTHTALATLATNGVVVGSATQINFILGSNTVLVATNNTGTGSLDVSISATGSGAGGAQTPWESDIDGAGFGLTNVARAEIVSTNEAVIELQSTNGAKWAVVTFDKDGAGSSTNYLPTNVAAGLWWATNLGNGGVQLMSIADGSEGEFLQFQDGRPAFAAGPSSSPGGANMMVQINHEGTFTAATNLLYDITNNVVTLANAAGPSAFMFPTGSLANPAIRMGTGNEKTGWYRLSTNQWLFGANGTAILSLDINGMGFGRGVLLFQSAVGGSSELRVTVDGANIGSFHSVATAITNRVYGVRGSASDGEWIETGFDNRRGAFFLRSQTNTTAGRTLRPLELGAGTNAAITITASNSIVINNTVDTTAAVATTINKAAGKVRISSGQSTYYVTNSFVTSTNAIVVMTINTSGGAALSGDAPAITPTPGLLTIDLVNPANTDCDISWAILSP